MLHSHPQCIVRLRHSIKQAGRCAQAEVDYALSCACVMGNAECMRSLIEMGGRFDPAGLFWVLIQGRMPCGRPHGLS